MPFKCFAPGQKKASSSIIPVRVAAARVAAHSRGCFSPRHALSGKLRHLPSGLRLEGRGFGLHMIDFRAEELRGEARNFNAPYHAESQLEHEAGMLHRLWVWLAAGAGTVVTAVGISTIVSIGLAWTFVSGLLHRDQAEGGRAILQRIVDLTALQTGSQSALGCLDVSPGDPLEEICERTIFANPQTVAGANAFVAARLSVLGDALASGVRSAPAGAVMSLRQNVENDPFGIVAHVLAARYGCSASRCSTFAMLTDSSKVVANLNARTYENLVARYAPHWQGQGGPAVSALPGQGPAVAAVSSLLGQGPPVVAPVLGSSPNLRPAPTGGPPRGLNVPPPSSIPAVSIMTEEPSRAPPAPTGTPSAASGSTQRSPAPSRSSPRTQPPTPPPPPPVQISPDPPNPG
jgi:hypothetical protein